jgi:eukaryotic-like serine/threonine-protein kinase
MNILEMGDYFCYFEEMSQAPSLINKQVGKYIISNEISRGGMGIIFLGKHVTLNRYAAIKMLFPHLAGEANFVKRFREETNAMSKVKHSNIVDIYDYEEAHGTYFIIMEVVVGRSVESYLKEVGPMTPGAAARIIRQVLDALEYAHEKGVLHRDIKPSNIMIDQNGLVKVLDFGIAKIIGGENLTQTGFVVGSPHYISPEQAQGESVGQASDLYSVAVVLFQMLAGRPPFVSETPVGVIMAHIKDAPPKVRKFNPNISPSLEKFVLKGLEKKPENRYQTAKEMREAMDKIILPAEYVPVDLLVSPAQKAELQAEATSLMSASPAGESPDIRSGSGVKSTPSNRKFSLISVVDYGILIISDVLHLSWRKTAGWTALLLIVAAGIWLSVSIKGRTFVSDSYHSISQRFASQPRQAETPSPFILAIPQHLPDRFGNILGIDFELIPSGTFTMGGKPGTTGALDDTPDHEVLLDAYMISRSEITNRQYSMFVRDTGYAPPANWPSHEYESGQSSYPVTNVSWFDANVYCQWLSRKTGLTFRLPTEAEWERAANSGGKYPWGDRWTGKNANTIEAGLAKPSEAGAFSSDNSLSGIKDMGGNVREWVNDNYSMSAYAIPARKNPQGPDTGDKRVVRGGAFDLGYQDARITRRDSQKPTGKEDNLGFRIVLQQQG